MIYDFVKKDSSILGIVAGNAVVLLGVIFLRWDAMFILLAYIVETFIIGLFNMAKMATAQKDSHLLLKIFLIPFFMVHYNMFVFVQSIFVFVFASIANPAPENVSIEPIDQTIGFLQNTEFLWTVFALFLSHAYSFVFNFIKKGEYKLVNAGELMMQPYKRIFIQQFVVIIGGMAIIAFNEPAAMLYLLVALKTALDIVSHKQQHDWFEQQMLPR